MNTSADTTNRRVLFPNMLLRIAGLPLNELAGLVSDTPAWRVEQEQAREQRRRRDRETLLNDLFVFIQQCPDQPKTQKILQNLRRNLYNDRDIRVRDRAEAEALLPESLHRSLENYLRLVESLKNYRRTSERLYHWQAAAGRRRFQQQIQQEAFRKGLALSSLTLLDTLPHYAQTPPDRFRKNDYQVENGLLRYFTRMATKTSPYSTFTRLAFVPIGESAAWPVAGTERSHVQLNAGLLDCFRAALYQNRALRLYLSLRINPSLHEEDGKLLIIRQASGEVACGRLPANRMIRAVLKAVGEGNVYGKILDALVLQYRLKAIDVHHYVDKLTDLGLLQTDLGISPNDPAWPQKLQGWMRMYFWAAPAFVGALLTVLDELVDTARRLPAVSAAARRTLIGQAAQKIQEITRNGNGIPVSADFLSIRPEQLFREDVTLPETAVSLPENHLNRLLGSWGKLTGFVRQTGGIRPRHDLEELFRQAYGPDSAPVPLTDFFEKYLRRQPDESDPEPDVSDAVQAQWTSLMRSVGADGVVHIHTHALPDADSGMARSGSLFLQGWYDAQNRLNGVLNGAMPGYGRFFGRFLRYFDPQMTVDLRHWNQQTAGRVRLTETADGAVHNANMHPALLSGQVQTPGGHELPDAESFPLSDLLVRLTEGGHLEVVRQSTGQTVELHDMGFQAHRSLLMQFLSRLAPAEPTGLGAFCHVISQAWRIRTGVTEGPVAPSPRVVVDGRLVLQRRQWVIQVPDEPALSPVGEPFGDFVSLTTWRQRWQIPDEVFVHLPDTDTTDDRKPQYIHFRSPMLVDLFRRLLRKALNGSGRLKLVEMYPNTQQAMRFDGMPYATELVPLWYRFGGSTESGQAEVVDRNARTNTTVGFPEALPV